MKCPNLQNTFPQYQITFDPAIETKDDPWMMQIPCKFGLIYPHGEYTLAIEIDGHPHYANLLSQLAIKMWQDGDNEKTFVFHLDQFKEVASIVKPKRKHTKTLSEERRNELRERMRIIRGMTK